MKSLLITTVSTLFLSVLIVNVDKTEKLKDNSVANYQLDENGKKSGPFKITSSKGGILLSGSYKDGNRVNDWYCFDRNGNVTLRYNYNLKKLILLSEKQIADYEFKVDDSNAEVQEKFQAPFPICSAEQFKGLLISEFIQQIPAKQKTSKANLKGEVTALISETGRVKYFVKYVLDGYEYKTSVDLDNKVFNVEWIPATYKDKTYKSEAKFNIDVAIDPTTERRFIWNY
ncbi:hypothetical protein [Pedobacter sp. Leaf170]|uniref:hypothetical protein n=1 Tax=Pedobacter sp. Leaf170 TaxID=2876558 RepID=UPI001E5BF1CB|nr:hypothetical protein [Pedobacter sp. Leaf170]